MDQPIKEGEIVDAAPVEAESARPAGEMGLMPRLVGSPALIAENMKAFRDFVKGQMVEGEDYMAFDDRPGAKNNLLKPGAEKLLTYHGFGAEFTLDKQSSHEDFDPVRPFLRYVYRVRIFDKRTGVTIVDGIDGEANSYEDRFYSSLKGSWDLTPMEKQAAESGAYPMVERPRKDGSGKVRLYRVPNAPNVIFGMSNTIRKMALKRALVPGAIMATRASGIFTQDLEDMDVGHRERKAQPAKQASEPVAATLSGGVSLETMGVVRGLAQNLGLDLDAINALANEHVRKPWMKHGPDGSKHYPCSQDEAETIVSVLKAMPQPVKLAPKPADPAKTVLTDLDEIFGGQVEED